MIHPHVRWHAPPAKILSHFPNRSKPVAKTRQNQGKKAPPKSGGGMHHISYVSLWHEEVRSSSNGIQFALVVLCTVYLYPEAHCHSQRSSDPALSLPQELNVCPGSLRRFTTRAATAIPSGAGPARGKLIRRAVRGPLLSGSSKLKSGRPLSQ
jgi:hypothetical protein